MFSLHASDVVCRLRLVCNLLYAGRCKNPKNTKYIVGGRVFFLLFCFSQKTTRNYTYGGDCVASQRIHVFVLQIRVSHCSKTRLNSLYSYEDLQQLRDVFRDPCSHPYKESNKILL